MPTSQVTSAERSELRFVPSGWLVVSASLARLVLSRGKFGKLGIAALLWSVAPRKLRLVLWGVLGSMLLLLLGASAAIALLVLQIA